MKYASFGSISTGTLRTADLLASFAAELSHHVKANFDNLEPKAIYDYAATIGAAECNESIAEHDPDHADDILTDLQEALQHFAPPYAYFGALEGDGADFGFWPSIDAVKEYCTQISDPADVENHLGEECFYVNDHGNVTVYAADGSVIWDCV